MGHSIVSSTHGREKPAHKPAITFDGTSGLGQDASVTPIFSITGSVIIDLIIAKCLTDLVGATATISLGIASIVDLFVAVDLSTDVNAGAFWLDSSPTLNGMAIPSTVRGEGFVIDEDIGLDHLVADTTGGVMEFFVYWRPLGSGLLVPA